MLLSHPNVITSTYLNFIKQILRYPISILQKKIMPPYTFKHNCRYKLSLIAADGTAEAKFFCHDVVARQIIRRNCDSLIKTIGNTPGLPPQMLATIGKTYTFAVGLTDESYRSMQSRTYLIDSVIFRPQQQQLTAPTPLALEPAPQLAIQAEEGKFGTQTNVETVAATNKDANILVRYFSHLFCL